MGPRRQWGPAREKLEMEGSCRRCGAVVGLECAHTMGREHDRNEPLFHRPWKPYTVAPERIIPLDSDCHRLQHERKIDILPLLTVEEQLQAVADAGSIELARRALAPSAYPERQMLRRAA